MYEYRRLSEEEREAVVQERIARGYPPHRPPHPIERPGDFLITAACYEHAHLINTPGRRAEVEQALATRTAEYHLELKAWVVLENHYHVLVEVPETAVLGRVAASIHGPLSLAWNRQDGCAGRKVWYRYADRAMRSLRHYYTTLNYIHYNPVKHGLVDSPYDWPWSSLGWYAAQYGRAWLRDCWVAYPVRDYGAGWDE